MPQPGTGRPSPSADQAAGALKENDVPKTTIAVEILNHEYQVRCDEGDVNDLIASARQLDARMREVHDGGKVFGLDRITVIAALNIAHDNLRLRNQLDALDGEVSKLTSRVEGALTELQPDA